MKKIYMLICIFTLMCLTGCVDNEKNNTVESVKKDKRIIAEEYVGEGGYVIESNYCYST